MGLPYRIPEGVSSSSATDDTLRSRHPAMLEKAARVCPAGQASAPVLTRFLRECLLCDLLLPSARSFFVQCNIPAHHLFSREILGHVDTDFLWFETQVANPLDHLSNVAADVAGDAILHDFRD